MGVFGPNLKKRRTKKASFMGSNDPGEKPSVHEDMRKIFNVEDHQTEYFLQKSAPVKRITPSHDRAIKQFYTTLRVHNNQATAELLWKDPEGRPKNNFVEAYDLFLRCEEFYRAPEIREAIQEIITEWDLVGFIMEVDLQEAKEAEYAFYIPTFVVSRLDKQTTKHRLVFNGAREFGEGSLNDFLIPGPNNVPDLAEVLLKISKTPLYLYGGHSTDVYERSGSRKGSTISKVLSSGRSVRENSSVSMYSPTVWIIM